MPACRSGSARRDPVTPLYYDDVATAYPEFVLIGIDRNHPGRLVAEGYSVPFTWDRDPDESLPAGGWDEVILTAALDRLAGRLADWRAWTGLPFDATGPVEVPGALVPVHCDTVHDHAVYCEPCVWVHHRLF